MPAFESPLTNGWVDWTDPRFVPTEEVEWNKFLDEQRRRYADIDRQVRTSVTALDGIVVLSVSSHDYSMQFEHPPSVVGGGGNDGEAAHPTS